jgi:hypothetical protein
MLLTPDQFREHVTTALEDDAIGRLLNAAEAAITEVAGPYGAAVTELVEGRYTRVLLSRPALEIVSVRESSRDVDADYSTTATTDYALDGGSIVRRRTGAWNRLVEVTYKPANDAALRMSVQVQLVELALNWQPGLSQNTAGNWTEQFPNADEYEAQRQAILAQLRPSVVMAIV